MTLNDLAVIIAKEQGIKSTHAKWIAQIEEWINAGRDEFEKRAYWNHSKHTPPIEIAAVEGDARYPVDSTMGEILHIRIKETEEEIFFKPFEKLIEEELNLEEGGAPESYFISGYTFFEEIEIQFYKVPDATARTFEVHGQKKFAKLATGEQIEEPRECFLAFQYYVNMRIAMVDRDKEEAAAFNQLFEGCIQYLINRGFGFEKPVMDRSAKKKKSIQKSLGKTEG